MGNRWLLLRGLVRESGHWGDFPKKLAEKFPADQVHCLDLPGCGAHYRKKSPESIDEIARFVLKNLPAGISRENTTDQTSSPACEPSSSEKTILFAISMGAMVSAVMMKQEPRTFDGAVFMNTSFRGISPFYKRLQPKSYLTILKTFVSRSLKERERFILGLSSNEHATDPRIIDDWVALAEQNPISRENAVRQLMAAARFKAPVIPPSQPILVLTSDDQLVSPECSHLIHKQWQTDFAKHPTAGHDITIDDPQWVLEQVEAWVKRTFVKD